MSRRWPRCPGSAIRFSKPEERKSDFREVGLGLTEEEAVREANRCLACGICSECYQCVDACIAGAIDHEMTVAEETIEVGSIIAAPGFEVFDPRLRGEYGYGLYPNVVTSIQFERILSASGPYFGHVQRISDGKEPKKVAFIQCVGSRDTSCGNSWCSSVCCMYATKEAIIAKEHAKGLEPTIFFMDIRAHGKDFDRFVNRAKGEYGIRYIRSMPSTIKELQQSKNLLITYVREDGSARRGGVRHGRPLRRPHAAEGGGPARGEPRHRPRGARLLQDAPGEPGPDLPGRGVRLRRLRRPQGHPRDGHGGERRRRLRRGAPGVRAGAR